MFEIAGRRPGRKFRAPPKANEEVKILGKFLAGPFALPTSVDGEKIEASYQDGVLKLALPKAEAAKPRKIALSDGKSSFWSKLISQRVEQKKEIPIQDRETTIHN